MPPLRDLSKRAAAALSTAWAQAGGRRGRSGALVYHRIAEPVAGLTPPTWSMTPAQFERQIVGLRDAGVRFVRAEALAEAARQSAAEGAAAAVAVTFDDVFGCVAVHAVPVLRRLGIPATFFVSTAYVGDPGPLPFDDWADAARAPSDAVRPLTRAELADLAADPLFEIGAHTHTHADFRGRPDALRADLSANVRWLACLGVDRPSFAFPYGRTAYGFAGGALSEAARQTGVARAFTTDARPFSPVADPFCLPRYTAYAWDTAASLLARLDGYYDWAPRLLERAEAA